MMSSIKGKTALTHLVIHAHARTVYKHSYTNTPLTHLIMD